MFDYKTKSTVQVAAGALGYYMLATGKIGELGLGREAFRFSPEVTTAAGPVAKFLLGYMAFDGLRKLGLSSWMSLGAVGVGIFGTETMAKKGGPPLLGGKTATGWGDWGHGRWGHEREHEHHHHHGWGEQGWEG